MILDRPEFTEIIEPGPALRNLASDAADELRALADRVQACPPHSSFHAWEVAFSQLSFAAAFQMQFPFENALGKDCQSIYALHIVDGPSTENVLRDLKAVKDRKEQKYPRLMPIEKCGDSQTLYVGSSHKTPRRLAEHLGMCPAGTYGLRLGQWATHWPGKLRIEVTAFDGIDANILQILEDHLASELNPVVGKRGGR